MIVANAEERRRVCRLGERLPQRVSTGVKTFVDRLAADVDFPGELGDAAGAPTRAGQPHASNLVTPPSAC